MTATQRWTTQLHQWAIPAEILDQAPRNPYEFPPAMIRKAHVEPLSSPTGVVTLERLGPGERLLDVGCGAGRISGAFTADHEVVGVEPRPALAQVSREAGVTVIEGRWPDQVKQAGTAEVCLCTHVLYDVQEPQPFLVALAAAARRRVVVEVTGSHPWTGIGPLYELVHGISRPTGPTAELLVQVIQEACGVMPQIQDWTRPGSIYADAETMLDQDRRMLCIGADHPKTAALAEAVMARVQILPSGEVQLPPVRQATIWWDVDG
ncbi:MAG: methyltransferase domain-containing protein [Euzebya sp.]